MTKFKAPSLARRSAGTLALVWIGTFGMILVVLVVLPDPPGAGDERLPSVLLDYLFGAIAIAVAVGVACVLWTISLVSRLNRDIEERLDQLEKGLETARRADGRE
jgi:hypothetical protein